MNRDLAQSVRERASRRCEYCRISETSLPLPFQIDHIIAEKHGGEAAESNLALACPHCNLYKGPNIAGFDSNSGMLTRLFHPRTDRWDEHFRFEGPRIVGRTPIGRATAQVLGMNTDAMLSFRAELVRYGS